MRMWSGPYWKFSPQSTCMVARFQCHYWLLNYGLIACLTASRNGKQIILRSWLEYMRTTWFSWQGDHVIEIHVFRLAQVIWKWFVSQLTINTQANTASLCHGAFISFLISLLSPLLVALAPKAPSPITAAQSICITWPLHIWLYQLLVSTWKFIHFTRGH